jgi:hypothetical protein
VAKLPSPPTLREFHVHLDLLIPALLSPLRQQGADLLQGMDLPALSCLAARGSLSAEPWEDTEAWLAWRFGVSGSAPYCLEAEGWPPATGYWLHADPVHFDLQRHGLTLADATLFSVSREEADILTADLSAHFSADGLVFSAPAPERWYATSRHPLPDVRPLAEARGGPVEANPFRGDDGLWQRLWSELQMFLHQHPVNARREARGEPAINSLWLWGGGRAAEKLATPYTTVHAGHLQARGLQSLAGGQHAPLPPSALHLPAGDGMALVVLDALRLPAAYGDLTAWRESLQKLERDWLIPLKQRLERGTLASLGLFLPAPGGGHALQIRRRDLWRIWRRPALTTLFEQACP